MIAGILLAAGASMRFDAPAGKLLADLGGRPVVRHSAEILCAAVDRAIIVLPRNEKAARAIAAAVTGLGMTEARAEGPEMSASIRAGVRALPEDSSAAVIALGDQPLLPHSAIPRLVARWEDELRAPLIVAPTYQAVQGNPVLFARPVWPELLALTGDTGARAVVSRDASRVTLVDMEMPMPQDVDTLHDLAAARERVAR